MKAYTIQLAMISSLVLSPRNTCAFYKGIDFEGDVLLRDDLDDPAKVYAEKNINIIFPFYQYGLYERYEPDRSEYYVPGSSIKGALGRQSDRMMVDDIHIAKESIVLRRLHKIQKIDRGGGLEVFFPNVANEMLPADNVVEGKLFFEGDIALVIWALKKASDIKLQQMQDHLQNVIKRAQDQEIPKEPNGAMQRKKAILELKTCISDVQVKMREVQKMQNVLILGGYKGLQHAMVFEAIAKNGKVKRENRSKVLEGGLAALKTQFDFNHNDTVKEEESLPTEGAVFIDPFTNLPHGIARIRIEETR